MNDERSQEARAVAELALVRLFAGGAPTSESLIRAAVTAPSAACSASSAARSSAFAFATACAASSVTETGGPLPQEWRRSAAQVDGTERGTAGRRDDRLHGEQLESAVAELERLVRQRAALEARVEEERDQVAVLSELAKDLKADNFGEHLVQKTLRQLAAHASKELLRISDGRYSLIPVEGDFHVIDHVNADERRSAKTLSGGETFMASLALALALSRHIGELAGGGLGARLEAVFIDEVFGTLDTETLEEVIGALERLHAEDLMVGVITHVPELAARIQAGLRVAKDGGASTIEQAAA